MVHPNDRAVKININSKEAERLASKTEIGIIQTDPRARNHPMIL